METYVIPTEYGEAAVWWDDRDPSNSGWVLRYHLERADSPDALGRRHLDEPLDTDGGDPRQAALTALASMGIGGGERCTAAQAAEVAGLRNGATWRATSWRPAPDGHWDARTPWWWETSILRAMRDRPGMGARTDLH